MEFIGFILAFLVGISLGLFGSGGSILSVPILVYVFNVAPTLATAYSLFIVGNTAFIGAIQKIKQGAVDFSKVFLFGIPSILSVFITRKWIVPSIPNTVFLGSNFSFTKSVLIMIFFSIVMMVAALKMIKPSKTELTETSKNNFGVLILLGILIGFLAGFVGAGGGFLIVPVLIFLAKTPINKAIGTSLIIVGMQSLIGFFGDYQNEIMMDWKLLIQFSLCSISGIFIGNFIAKKVNVSKLKIAFGWFVLAIGIGIFVKEFFKN